MDEIEDSVIPPEKRTEKPEKESWDEEDQDFHVQPSKSQVNGRNQCRDKSMAKRKQGPIRKVGAKLRLR